MSIRHSLATTQLSGFRGFLLASCFLAAAAGWLTGETLSRRGTLAALALAAALPLLTAAQSEPDEFAWSDDEPVSPEQSEKPEVESEQAPSGDPVKRRRWPRRRRRRSERLLELEQQVGGLEAELAQMTHGLDQLTQTLRQAEIRFEQRLADLHAITHGHQQAFDQSRQAHLQQLGETVAANKAAVAALERMLATPSAPRAVNDNSRLGDAA